MPNVFDEKGLITKGFNEYRTDMSNTARALFADKLDGAELRTDDSSTLGRILSTVAKPLVENSELLPLILQAFDINSAEGQQLDNLLWGIHRIKRKPESSSTGMVMLYGDLGTTINSGSTVSNSLTGDVYRTDSTVTLSTSDTNGVDVEITAVGGEYRLSYSIVGFLSESPAIVVQTGSQDTTIRAIADRFVDAVNSQSSYLTATRNNDNSVKVVITDQGKIGSFSVSGDCSIVRSYMPAYITSTTYSTKESLRGQVTNIGSPVLGWRGVTNPYYIFPSAPVESDEDYRYRGKLKLQYSSGSYNSILMALKSVRGVVYENIQQNTSSNTTSGGIINNGLAITVQGGNEDDIALAISNSISVGIITVGDIVKSVKDINGSSHEIRFSRPSTVPLEISMSLVTYSNFPNTGIIQIKQAIVEWFNNLNVGEDVYYSRLYEPINSIGGFAVRNLKIGLKGGTLGNDDVIINHSEIATISADDIKIGGI